MYTSSFDESRVTEQQRQIAQRVETELLLKSSDKHKPSLSENGSDEGVADGTDGYSDSAPANQN